MDHFYGAKQDIDGPIAYGCIFLNALSILFLNKGFNDSFGSKTEKIHKVKEKYQTFIANLQVSQKKMLFAVVLLAAVATTFVRLGSTEIPKTGAFPPANLIVNLPLGSLPNHLWVFSHGAEGTIDVECGTQQNLKKFKIDMSYSWFYGWKETDISGCGSDISLAFKIANGGKIGELAFYSNSSFVSPITVCEGTKCIPATNSVFFDEPKLDQQNFQHGTYFDEVYYARAVTELLAGKYPWENTHPALGKFIMTWWIQLTDLNPLQWRTMNAFFGVCLCILVFFMLMDLTGNFNITLFGSLFVIFDFSRITLSRIATIDIMTCFFMTGSYWILGRIVRDFTVRNKSFITLKNCVFLALFLSFAISIKWNAVFTVVACFCVLCGFILQRILKGLKVDYARILGALSIIFVIAPTVIYFLSFQPFHWYLSTGYSFDKFLQDQVNMYQYHSNLKATHGFSSPFWSWPFIQRPMWFYTDRALDEGWYYTITVLGNPLIWWAFFPAIVFLFMRKYFSRNMPTLVFFLAFCAQFFCWMIASRITFIYHFLPSAVFGCILLAIALNELLQKYRYFVTAYLIGAGTCVVLFWPVVTGLKVSQNYAQYLKWFSSWYF